MEDVSECVRNLTYKVFLVSEGVTSASRVRHTIIWKIPNAPWGTPDALKKSIFLGLGSHQVHISRNLESKIHISEFPNYGVPAELAFTHFARAKFEGFEPWILRF